MAISHISQNAFWQPPSESQYDPVGIPVGYTWRSDSDTKATEYLVAAVHSGYAEVTVTAAQPLQRFNKAQRTLSPPARKQETLEQLI